MFMPRKDWSRISAAKMRGSKICSTHSDECKRDIDGGQKGEHSSIPGSQAIMGLYL